MKSPPIVPDQHSPSRSGKAAREMAKSFEAATAAVAAFKCAIEPHRLAILLIDS